MRDSVHLFLLQSRMRDRIRAWIDSSEGWPPLARSIAYKWLDEGLEDRAITRDLSWGIPVLRNGKPRPGFENKVFYVWFDAPIEYIASTMEWAAATGGDWQRWWRTDAGASSSTYIQFMGKDNVAFHTVSFPITILGSREPWKLVDRLKAFNWLTWYGGKFSTREKRGVFMDQALALLPSDYWRWRLIVNSPESADSAFSWEDFSNGVNSDLANVLGNFVNRVTSFTASKFAGRVPQYARPGTNESELFADLEMRLRTLTELHEALEFRRAAAETRSIWVLGNEYLQKAAPWTTITTDPKTASTSVYIGLSLCLLFATIAAPILPDAAARIVAALGLRAVPAWPYPDVAASLRQLVPGQIVGSPGLLFEKIEDADVAAWRDRFQTN
jgi:methionyl-tRNA synthetase